MKEFKEAELLAPAGSIEAFFAAIDSGADALYAGLKSFSARGRARNFSIADLEKVIPYAHSRDKKVYIALNTILKEGELEKVIYDLSALSCLGADAVIIQDLGLYRILRTYFPDLTIHASTQMTVHNSAGINQLASMGFKRIVVAREMTLKEIKAAKKKSDVEIEAFVHGSMCFSYAGSCFFSSYLGGKSSNRGVCVQPCRREYRDGREEMNPFSMGDLSTIELIPQIIKAGIDSFKIEGRMKSVEYVENVVKAYRMVMDAENNNQKDAIDQAKELLKDVMSRQRTSGFFLDERPLSITVPGRSGNMGKFAGKVIKCVGTRALFKSTIDLHTRDRLRVQNVKTGGRTAFSLRQIWLKGKKVNQSKKGDTIEITVPGSLNKGDALFKTTSHEHRGKNIEAKRRLDKIKGIKIQEESKLQAAGLLEKLLRESISPPKDVHPAGTLVRVGDLRDVPRVSSQCNGLIIPLVRATIHNLKKHLKRLKAMKERIVWSLPLVIQEGEIPFYKDVIDFLGREGFANWQVSNISHFNLLKDGHFNISSSHYIHALNSAAIQSLSDLGCSRITLSIESDGNNLEALVKKGATAMGDLLVYSHLPLYVSRVKWTKKKKGLGGQEGGEYIPKERDGLTYVFAEKPFSFFGYMKRFKKMGFKNFQIDLSGESRQRDNYQEILSSYKSGKWLEECSSMNMETGLE
ncbi:MAG: U32 family peptidase [Deltaproteobacteria bacterium]|nr:U32 family peptidase [Deltaproteobacteria bacterium]